MTIFAIIDCNNFYVSCERVFNPGLINKPVVVLSNNDGCLISCSNEVKALGIKMGTPYFKFKDTAKKLGVIILSSNYTLYGDMSARVVQTIGDFGYNMEVYSIDEAFLELQVENEQEGLKIARRIRERVYKCTGIGVSIGLAKTKTLSKVANKIAKVDGRKQNLFEGVFSIIEKDPKKVLAEFPVEDIWGVGYRYAKMLKSNNIITALDFVNQDPLWVQQKMTIQGKLTWCELQNQPFLKLEDTLPAKKSMASTRAFGQPITELNLVRQALATHATRIGLKLRQQKSISGVLYIFVMTNRFQACRYYQGITITFEATNFTPILISNALKALDKIFVPGLKYTKTGVIALHIQPGSSPIPKDLFQAPLRDTNIQNKITKSVDAINHKYGRSTIVAASSLATGTWQMRQDYRTPRYTTVWQEIIRVK